jgi:hypothetical protein
MIDVKQFVDVYVVNSVRWKGNKFTQQQGKKGGNI